ncbi:hypothetical protein GLOIN_2v1886663 [Rhizophagus irregularis DAOM 181602=DAOM 197198]|uniref:Uncharacterized protein n=1 Tax=Rhizophagus irregularis (strain DAOM 181602 / DAOM 197198 / MUCL 43194) TaxID=747089 RepID=A0A2P4NLE6_RHIID|nr:hypothetical protein GLOIN_2v1886663 [Rhizophagus irregularis DAOM 181602=DAOM 197198]POG53960.1 hypothetical protein GLOIN_2v1886663 [Rhizophagus irregularis DAOM 181602=DAOM 197198]|eukprot:XP_025164197.1 hypothetical protein GLOIN_2v1886663 [Rhizophagus irregularis DAOM 181602=DAOM 197198]
MNAKNKKSSFNKTTCSLCQFTDNSTRLYTKTKLSLHQKQLHPNNHVIPHIQQLLLDSISDTQVRKPFSEELFVKIFSNEESFTYIPYLKKYKCVFTGEAGYNRLGYLFDCKDWGEKNHVSGTKAYVFMENEKRKKDVTFIWSDFVVTRIRDGKKPLILHSPKLVVSFTIYAGYFVKSQEDDTNANIFKKCEECIMSDNSNNEPNFYLEINI